ncbi:chromate transporter [Desulfobacter hydrogenophilus]|uniref:Chromate efflux transporter n=1 Tax=Desulfobacter hydrogenophilus TaxID=2291 RepID=A0A328FIU8_9BACT|nr:chromate efflux transporter [Desulfobacter hydrogenophilus]NDY71063.1 chromate efflux transporter [Desulfobacter hydrogenophilus]QBH11704.1 chromate efflux transporter [Desulfobacter hydrogenophilus]RAM02917.1 chromate transporter [Desulfobacter hydrogenophilus]
MSDKKVSLWFLFLVFVKIGCIAFGGFTALIAVVENEMIRKRGLLSTKDMLNGVSLAMLLPGPVAVNTVGYAGFRLRGGWGAFLSVTGVILPSFFLLIGLSHIYFTYGAIPVVSKLFAGFIPAVTAIIITTAWNMGKKAITNWSGFFLGLSAAVILLGVGGFYTTLMIIVGAGLAGLILYTGQKPDTAIVSQDRFLVVSGISKFRFYLGLGILAVFLILFFIPVSGLENNSLARIFVTFSGMSLMLFGGGFVFIPLIQEIVVDGLHWVSLPEFTSAIAMGQVTPGPILISAAFIGYKIKGLIGAALATFAIFFPSALLMITASQVLDRIKGSGTMQAALTGIRAALVGMVFAAAVVIGRGCEYHWATPVIFFAALAALMRFKVDIAYIIPCAGLIGVLLY